jgi:hypothetical protein
MYNAQNLTAWRAHLRGACRIIECNGPEKYIYMDSPTRSLAEYVRGMDVIRAVSVQDETIFGKEEWDCLMSLETNKVCRSFKPY